MDLLMDLERNLKEILVRVNHRHLEVLEEVLELNLSEVLEHLDLGLNLHPSEDLEEVNLRLNLMEHNLHHLEVQSLHPSVVLDLPVKQNLRFLLEDHQEEVIR